MKQILVVDDEPEMHWVLTELLRRDGWSVTCVESGLAALDALSRKNVALVLMDQRMPGIDGLETIKRIREMHIGVPVIFLSAYGEASTVVQAMRRGACDFLTKPLDNKTLLSKVRSLLNRTERSHRRPGVAESAMGLTGESPQIVKVREVARRAAASGYSVLIQGETGVGKEVLARAIHRVSPRAKGPFVAADCGAIPMELFEAEFFGHEAGAYTGATRRVKGRFQLAHTGLLFLDEINNLTLPHQAKLLRVLETRRVWPLGADKSVAVDVQIVAASSVDLFEASAAGRFRLDLFHRLSEIVITIPPLAERPEDILALARQFIAEASRDLERDTPEITEAAAAFLTGLRLSGNARELRNVIRRGVLTCDDQLDVPHLERPEMLNFLNMRINDRTGRKGVANGMDSLGPLKAALDAASRNVEKELIERALQLTKGNKAEAARLLEIDYKTLYNKLKEHNR